MVHSLQHDFGDSEGRLGDSVLIWSVEKAGPLAPDSRGRRIERIPTVGLGQRCRFGWLQSSKPLCAPIHPSSQPPAQGEALLNRDPVFTALTEQLEKRLQKFKDEERDMSREEIPSMGLTGLGMSLSSPFFLLLSFLGCKGNALCGCGHLGLSQERGPPPLSARLSFGFCLKPPKRYPQRKTHLISIVPPSGFCQESDCRTLSWDSPELSPGDDAALVQLTLRQKASIGHRRTRARAARARKLMVWGERPPNIGGLVFFPMPFAALRPDMNGVDPPMKPWLCHKKCPFSKDDFGVHLLESPRCLSRLSFATRLFVLSGLMRVPLDSAASFIPPVELASFKQAQQVS